MSSLSCDVLVLGAGPGGYVAAIRSGQLGLDTIIVEGSAPGGTCLNIGCIPSKALIHVASEFEKISRAKGGNAIGLSVEAPKLDLATSMSWKNGIVQKLTSGVSSILKKSGVRQIQGWGRMRDGKCCLVETPTGLVTINARHVILAPGSQPVELPFLPFGNNVISSTEALDLQSVPEKMVIVGAGYIGLELGLAFAKLGSSVSVVEFADRILPQYDQELSSPILKKLKSLGVELLLNAKAKSAGPSGNSLIVEKSNEEEVSIPADKILVTVGRRARLEGWGLTE
ncbi:MAG: FAD-dependent oxidoreductase, partial [Cohaesibacteraceae bacterium]|nr:FAD-dependent oxidoreductase [Cohaesibacteraceae bacterium]MBL4875234.1 FAD-dependent oxidoreductase [Cohaesibacteraceae bacterium]